MLADRCHNRPKTPSASRSVYRHGGLTLMEMLTRWVELEPMRRHIATTPRLRNERHGDNMKSEVRIDDDLVAELKSRARIEQMSVTRTLNRVIRAGLAASSRPCGEREWYEEATVQMGRPRVEIDKALALAAALDDEEIIREMSSCQ